MTDQLKRVKNIDSFGHVRGESHYVDDISVLSGTLYAAVLGSPRAHGKLKNIDLSDALKIKGVKSIISARDIPGENEIGGIFLDEPLFAEKIVDFIGQPIALVVAESEEIARHAVSKIILDIESLPVIVDPRIAAKNGHLIHPPRSFQSGNSQRAFDTCMHVFEGRVDSAGQEHLYIETQGAYAELTEKGRVKVVSSTQGPTAVQKICARVLGLPMHKIEVDVRRLGGGFGGKEDQATPWAVMAALAAVITNTSVKLVLHRLDDMKMTGKRHPYSSDFKIGLDKELKICAYDVSFYQNAGAAADLSPAVLERTLFHSNNTYYIPNLTATAYSCRTNLPPNTAFRGFGGPQGMLVIESAIAKAAESLHVDASYIQRKNLLSDRNTFHYGQRVKGNDARICFDDAATLFDLESKKRRVDEFNSENDQYKKGLAVMPICFGISFTKTHMNQASALVHIYQDGSVSVSTAAVEMGQGVNTKMAQVAARIFTIPIEKITVESTNTLRIANTSPSAASATADLNGKALEIACNQVKGRLNAFAVKENLVDSPWEELIVNAFLHRINLSQHAHYATPEIYFDSSAEMGEPFAYHVYGTSITEITLDCVRGIYEIDSVDMVHDVGDSMNHLIDLGQIEGGLVQGIGWMTTEELMYNDEGRLLSHALSTYKVPDIYAVPKKITVTYAKTKGSPYAIWKSKAVGEPPLMYGIGSYFAIRNAIRAFNGNKECVFSTPITPEKTLLALYSHLDKQRTTH